MQLIVYSFCFVLDVLLYCHITYCLHKIVSGHSVLLLLKIDWFTDGDDDKVVSDYTAEQRRKVETRRQRT